MLTYRYWIGVVAYLFVAVVVAVSLVALTGVTSPWTFIIGAAFGAPAPAAGMWFDGKLT